MDRSGSAGAGGEATCDDGNGLIMCRDVVSTEAGFAVVAAGLTSFPWTHPAEFLSFDRSLAAHARLNGSKSEQLTMMIPCQLPTKDSEKKTTNSS